MLRRQTLLRGDSGQLWRMFRRGIYRHLCRHIYLVHPDTNRSLVSSLLHPLYNKNIVVYIGLSHRPTLITISIAFRRIWNLFQEKCDLSATRTHNLCNKYLLPSALSTWTCDCVTSCSHVRGEPLKFIIQVYPQTSGLHLNACCHIIQNWWCHASKTHVNAAI